MPTESLCLLFGEEKFQQMKSPFRISILKKDMQIRMITYYAANKIT